MSISAGSHKILHSFQTQATIKWYPTGSCSQKTEYKNICNDIATSPTLVWCLQSFQQLCINCSSCTDRIFSHTYPIIPVIAIIFWRCTVVLIPVIIISFTLWIILNNSHIWINFCSCIPEYNKKFKTSNEKVGQQNMVVSLSILKSSVMYALHYSFSRTKVSN